MPVVLNTVSEARISEKTYETAEALVGGGYVIISTNTLGVTLQRYDDQGSGVGSPINLSLPLAWGHVIERVSIAGTIDGGLAVAYVDADYPNIWIGSELNSDAYNIYVQRLGADFSAVGGPIAVNDPNYNFNAFYPAVAALATGGFTVAWTSGAQNVAEWFSTGRDGSGYGVGDRTFNADGSPISGEVVVNSFTYSNQEGQQVAGLKDGGYVVTWYDAASQSIESQRFDAIGERVGIEQTVSIQDHTSSGASVTALEDGGYIIAWIGWNNIVNDPGIYLQRYSASGAKVLAEQFVTSNQLAGGLVSNVTVAGLAGGGYAVMWQVDTHGTETNVYTAVYDETGGPTDVHKLVNPVEPGVQHIATSLAALDNGGFVVTWTTVGDEISAGTYQKVFGPPAGNIGPTADDLSLVVSENALVGSVLGQAPGHDANGDVLIYKIIAGNDDYLFRIDTFTGNLSLNRPLDFETAQSHSLVVQISDGAQVTHSDVHISVTDVASHDDTLWGTLPLQVLQGGEGDDMYFVTDSSQTIYELSGEGHDAVASSVSYGLAANVEDLALTGNQPIGGSGNELDNKLYGNEADNFLWGWGGNDTLYGNGGSDILRGGEGADFIVGGEGDDTIDGGGGGDLLLGGAGRDTFVYGELDLLSHDFIADFAPEEDLFSLSQDFFPALQTRSESDDRLLESEFVRGTEASAIYQHIIYDAGSGALYYDPDGSGALAPILLANLGIGLAMTADDFILS